MLTDPFEVVYVRCEGQVPVTRTSWYTYPANTKQLAEAEFMLVSILNNNPTFTECLVFAGFGKMIAQL